MSLLNENFSSESYEFLGFKADFLNLKLQSMTQSLCLHRCVLSNTRDLISLHEAVTQGHYMLW